LRFLSPKQSCHLNKTARRGSRAYSEIEVRSADPGKVAAKQMSANEPSTERGIKPGVRQAELVGLLGSWRERGKSGEMMIVYAITDPNADFLVPTFSMNPRL